MQDGLLEVALGQAASASNSPTSCVVISLVDGLMSRLHLPVFLHSLQEAGMASRYIIYNLDETAYKACHQVALACCWLAANFWLVASSG